MRWCRFLKNWADQPCPKARHPMAALARGLERPSRARLTLSPRRSPASRCRPIGDGQALRALPRTGSSCEERPDRRPTLPNYFPSSTQSPFFGNVKLGIGWARASSAVQNRRSAKRRVLGGDPTAAPCTRITALWIAHQHLPVTFLNPEQRRLQILKNRESLHGTDKPSAGTSRIHPSIDGARPGFGCVRPSARHVVRVSRRRSRSPLAKERRPRS